MLSHCKNKAWDISALLMPTTRGAEDGHFPQLPALPKLKPPVPQFRLRVKLPRPGHSSFSAQQTAGRGRFSSGQMRHDKIFCHEKGCVKSQLFAQSRRLSIVCLFMPDHCLKPRSFLSPSDSLIPQTLTCHTQSLLLTLKSMRLHLMVEYHILGG